MGTTEASAAPSEVWAQLPTETAAPKVEIQLLDPQGEQLDYGRTKPFVMRRATST